MNNKGQSIFMGLVIGIALFMFGMLFINFIELELTNVQNATYDGGPGLNCGTNENPNMSISDGGMATCLITEAILPYFILIIISAAGGLITARILA